MVEKSWWMTAAEWSWWGERSLVHHRDGIPNGIGMGAIVGSIATLMAQVGGMNHTAVAAHGRNSGGV